MAAKEESENSGVEEPNGSTELRQDELIEKLVPDPAAPPDVIMLAGWMGKSHRAGYVRLYLTPLLNEYVEISEKDVLHHQPYPPAMNPLGGTYVWVRREANLQHTQTATQQVQAQFLQGGITSRFLPKAGMESQFIKPYGPTTHICIKATIFGICGVSLFNLCNASLFDICDVSLFDLCP